MNVTALGYLGLETASSLDEWSAFARDVLGASVLKDGDRLLLRIDEHVYRIEVRHASKNGVSHVGWDVGTPVRLAQLRERLAQSGVACEPGSAALCRDRGVVSMLQCRDPAGTQLELFYGRMNPAAPFVSPHGVRFVTGELGLGHVVFRANPYADTLRFYQELLGFRMTDLWATDEFTLVFMHCNRRHHSLALRPGNDGSELIHFMLEVEGVDAVGLAAERGANAISRTIGRHFNDGMFSCYFRTPSAFEVEYGTQGRLIDDATWSVGQIDNPSGWGHQKRPGA
jgi:3,4-dihydroxy-9,10-secoandrosta-1,3,5(10)-triene-9,17-dione 4,5-dioxygenase